MKKFLKAFTLAEATITLFLLSVIVAVLIPAAVNVAPDQFRTGLRNAYNMTSSTVDSLINNEILYPTEEMFDTSKISKGFLYESIGTKHTYNDETNAIEEETLSTTDDLAWEYEGLTKNCKCNNSKTKKLVRAFCCSMNVSSASRPDAGTSCTYTTNNGMVWTLTQNANCTEDTRNTQPILYVEVDLNGTGKPNSKTVTSPDQYKFSVFYNGRVELFTTADGKNDYDKSSAKAKTYLETPTKNKKKQ